MRLGPAAL